MRKTEYVEALRAEVVSAIEAYGLTWREAEDQLAGLYSERSTVAENFDS